MSSHLTCPTCHNKFFKISIMSTQHERKDTIKPSGTLQKLKKSTSSELEIALRNNTQLEKENASLRIEIHDLAVENDNLLKALNDRKRRFEEELKNLQDAIMSNESQLVENSKNCIEQQKKFVEEIKKLKLQNEDLIKEKNQTEAALTEKMKSLESEIKIMKLANVNLKSSNKENDDKCIKYKTKLRHAVKIVNELNQIVAQYGSKPEITCGTTQTDWENTGEKPKILDYAQCGDPRYKTDLNSENLLLSDIFFKSKAFKDSEIELFSSKSKSKCSVNVKIF